MSLSYAQETLSDKQKRILKEVYFDCTNPKAAQVALIEGPPGTGKSRIIVALILQLLFGQINGQKVILCASSNAAVDLIAAKLMKIRSKMGNKGKRPIFLALYNFAKPMNLLGKFSKFNIVRFGVQERMREDVRAISLQALLQQKICDQSDSADSIRLKEEVSARK